MSAARPLLLGRVVERNAYVLRAAWLKGWLISTVVLPALYLGALGVGLGGMIDERQAAVGGVPYLQFVAPGLLCATAMQEAAGAMMWPVLGGVQWDGRYLAMIATPLAPADIHRDELLWMALRSTVSGAVFLTIAGLLGGLRSPWAVLALPASVLTAVAFATILSGFAIRQRSDTGLSLVFRLGIMPIFLFSGSFFPVSVLPAGLRPVAWLSPLWHGVELARHATTGQAHWPADLGHVAVLAGIVVALMGWGRRGFEKRLTA
jgi:lipooligosaccharide transport system permease protein